MRYNQVSSFEGMILRNRKKNIKRNQLLSALHARSDLHIARKVWHMGAGLALTLIYMSGFPKESFISILTGILGFTVVVEIARLRNPVVNAICLKVFAPLIRINEVHKTTGVPYFVASTLISIVIFPQPVATLALLFLTFGDPVASFFGILFKKRSIVIYPGKSFQGTASAFIVCALVTRIYLHSLGIHNVDLIRLTLLGGFAGAFAELVPLEIDDNFSIPLVSGFIMWIGFFSVHFV